MRFSLGKYFCLYSILLVMAQPASAFNMLDAWVAAREHSATYQAAAYARDAAQEPQNQAKARLFPNIGVSANYRHYSQGENHHTQGWNVEVSQPLFDKVRWGEYESEQLTAQSANSEFIAQHSELLFNVSKAYLAILNAKEKLVAVAAEKAAYKIQIERAQALFHAGEATIIDTYEAQAGYDAADAKEIQLTTELEVAENTLADLTGLDPALIEPVSADDLPDFRKQTQEQQWIDLALANSVVLKTQRLKLQKSQAEIQTAASQHFPRLGLNAGYQDSRDYEYGRVDRDKGFYVGLQFTLPLYTGGEVSSKVRQLEALSAQEQANLVAQTDALRLQVKQAWAKIGGQQAQIRAQQQLLDTTNAKLGATRLGREVGVRNNMDEIKAEQERAAAQEQLADARYGYIEAWLDLLKISGQLHRSEGQMTLRMLFD